MRWKGKASLHVFSCRIILNNAKIFNQISNEGNNDDFLFQSKAKIRELRIE